MPKTERQLAVEAGVKQLLAAEAEAPEPAFDENAPRVQSLAEALAILIAELRASGDDEALGCEVLLRSFKPKLAKQTLLQAALVMRSLRYDKVVPILLKVARSAPSRDRRRMQLAPSHRKAL